MCSAHSLMLSHRFVKGHLLVRGFYQLGYFRIAGHCCRTGYGGRLGIEGVVVV